MIFEDNRCQEQFRTSSNKAIRLCPCQPKSPRPRPFPSNCLRQSSPNLSCRTFRYCSTVLWKLSKSLVHNALTNDESRPKVSPNSLIYKGLHEDLHFSILPSGSARICFLFLCGTVLRLAVYGKTNAPSAALWLGYFCAERHESPG
jgi:hypothetical protein